MTTIKKLHPLAIFGYLIYGLSILFVSILLIVDPVGLNAVGLILPLIAVLLVSSLTFSYRIATNSRNTSKFMSIIGTVLLSSMFTMVGFFIVAGVAWFVALSHV